MDLAGQQVSRNVIDKRPGRTGGVIAAILAFFLGRETTPDPDADLVLVTSAALDRGQDFWRRVIGNGYRDAHVVLVPSSGNTSTPCGPASSDSGPFYCPGNERIYLEPGFLRAIDGDLARAYVIAHELGHHVQKLQGELRGQSGRGVAVELEADCYAGAWMREQMERGDVANGDINAALAEAAAVGDDRLCPDCKAEEWTHGSSADRVAAVSRGIGGETCR